MLGQTSSGGRSRRPTLRDVAALAAVSVQTVSNVAHGRFDLMTDATRARVEAAMAEVGYHPNVPARGLREARTRTIAFLVLDEAQSFLADPLTALLVAGVGDVARDWDYGVLIHADRPLSGRGTLLSPVLEGRVDAAAVLMAGDPALRMAYVERLKDTDVPFVVFDEVLNDPTVMNVRTSERQSARDLTELLLSKGHRRLAFIGASLPWAVIEQRRLGFQDALGTAGIEMDPALEVFEGSWQADGGSGMAATLLSLAEPPTAIMCGSDTLAMGAISAIRRVGLEVPGDIAVTGFDDFLFAEHVQPPLTTVRIPGYELGRRAATMLLEALAGELPDPAHVVLDSEVVVRESA